MLNNNTLVEYIRRANEKYFSFTRNYGVIEAMREVDRADFLPPDMRGYAYFDRPAGIGYGQTCSQPSMVAFMLAELSVKKGDTVLEIGSGSGYAAAIASKLCDMDGKIYACEIMPELVEQMRSNLGGAYANIEIIAKDGSNGFPELAPFDKIFLSAGVDTKSFDRDILLSQLRTPGILLYPEARGRLFKVSKREGGIEETTYGEVAFVPLRGANS